MPNRTLGGVPSDLSTYCTSRDTVNNPASATNDLLDLLGYDAVSMKTSVSGVSQYHGSTIGAAMNGKISSSRQYSTI